MTTPDTQLQRRYIELDGDSNVVIDTLIDEPVLIAAEDIEDIKKQLADQAQQLADQQKLIDSLTGTQDAHDEQITQLQQADPFAPFTGDPTTGDDGDLDQQVTT